MVSSLRLKFEGGKGTTIRLEQRDASNKSPELLKQKRQSSKNQINIQLIY